MAKGLADVNFIEPWKEVIGPLEPKVTELINQQIKSYANDLLITVLECESPIEQLMAIALNEIIRKHELSFSPGIIALPQTDIKCFGVTYRADFLILVGDYVHDVDSCLKFVVECDGHDFHEKTKEQARKDKRRDRHLLISGYRVIHFTGSEIWADPFKCANEVIDTIRGFCKG